MSPAGNCPTQNHEVKLSVAKGQISGTCQTVAIGAFTTKRGLPRGSQRRPFNAWLFDASVSLAELAPPDNSPNQSRSRSANGCPLARSEVLKSISRIRTLRQKACQSIFNQRHRDTEQLAGDGTIERSFSPITAMRKLTQ